MIGSVIRQYRQNLGMTQEVLGRKVCVEHSTVNAWESGVCEPSLDQLVSVSVALHTTPNDILNFTGAFRDITTPTKSSHEMPWDDFEDGGGFDDDVALMGKAPNFAERISSAGFRDLLGFAEQLDMRDILSEDRTA